MNEEEDDIDTQEYGLVFEHTQERLLQANEEMRRHAEVTHDGDLKQEDIVTQDYKDMQYVNKNEDRNANNTNQRGASDNEDEQYPGVSNQKRVNIRAEQLFLEAQLLKKTHQADADQKRG
eukprot:9077738-Heterocapsa_arctica.AAC.1